MDPRTLAYLRIIAFTSGCAILGPILAVGLVGLREAGPFGFFAFIAAGCISWSASVGWFFRDVPPASPGRAFEVIPEAEEKR